jgi:hypothetical protein
MAGRAADLALLEDGAVGVDGVEPGVDAVLHPARRAAVLAELGELARALRVLDLAHGLPLDGGADGDTLLG